MTIEKKKYVASLIDNLPDLTAGQLYWVEKVVKVFEPDFTYEFHRADLFDGQILEGLGDAMRVHHAFSAEPFSKDKFEYVLVRISAMHGKSAELAPKGNPGHDITVDGIRYSLKTQADSGIKETVLWISKFMELGKGEWSDDPAQLEGLRDQFLEHMKSYERIIVLRSLRKPPDCKYELVEIPKDLLLRAKEGELQMMGKSKQNPKPGYCYVKDDKGEVLFELYFDGGSERKLQIKNLKKDQCRVHATWEFSIPTE
ncbi:MAG: restriction endonuclease [Bacteroidia bacterium]|nr:restriction endonuclease [Bacteroidia bacterium]